jgi:hypothetical protein
MPGCIKFQQCRQPVRERGLKNTLTFIVGSGLSPGSSSLSAPGTRGSSFIYGHTPSCVQAMQNTTECIRGVAGGMQPERKESGCGGGGQVDISAHVGCRKVVVASV